MNTRRAQPLRSNNALERIGGRALETPTTVRRAIALLWVALALGIVEGGVALLAAVPVEFGIAEALFLLLALLVNILAIYFAARRKNWARIVLFVFVILTVLALVFFPEALEDDPWWSIAVGAIATVLEVIALFWLFTGEGRRWYRTQPIEQGAF